MADAGTPSSPPPPARATVSQRAAQAPQMGLGAAFALVVAGVLAETTGVEFDGTTVGAWTALCEGLWQMIRRTMEG